MNQFTGQVVFNDRLQDWVFYNVDGTTDQSLTTASAGQDPQPGKIDLAEYKDEYLLVEGIWDHAWIREAKIVQHSAEPIAGESRGG